MKLFSAEELPEDRHFDLERQRQPRFPSLDSTIRLTTGKSTAVSKN
jgi:hypothetical protein